MKFRKPFLASVAFALALTSAGAFGIPGLKVLEPWTGPCDDATVHVTYDSGDIDTSAWPSTGTSIWSIAYHEWENELHATISAGARGGGGNESQSRQGYAIGEGSFVFRFDAGTGSVPNAIKINVKRYAKVSTDASINPATSTDGTCTVSAHFQVYSDAKNSSLTGSPGVGADDYHADSDWVLVKDEDVTVGMEHNSTLAIGSYDFAYDALTGSAAASVTGSTYGDSDVWGQGEGAEKVVVRIKEYNYGFGTGTWYPWTGVGHA